MTKLKKLVEESDKNEFQLCKYTGLKNRSESLEKVLSGEREITSLNLNLLSAYARGLGVKLKDILEDYDIDGTTSQVLGITRLAEKLRGVKDGNTEYRMDYQNGGYVLGNNLKKKVTDFPLKKDYEFLKTDKTHTQNTPEIEKLNAEFSSRKINNYTTRNLTLLNVSPRFNSKALSFLIYSPFEHGGDLKTAVSVFDKNDELMFSEVYGCEWIDKDDQKDVYYYKWKSFDEVITPSRILNNKKEMISEMEFYHGFYTQLMKFKVSY